MPDIDNIKEFNKILKSIGSGSGDAPEGTEDIPVPESPMGDDLAELLNTEQPGAESDLGMGPAAGDPEAQTEDPDFNTLWGEGSDKAAATEASNLDVLPMDFQEPATASTETDQAETPTGDDDLLADIPLDPTVGEQEEIPSIDLADLFPTGEDKAAKSSGSDAQSSPSLTDDMFEDPSLADTDLAPEGEEGVDSEPFDLTLDTENYQVSDIETEEPGSDINFPDNGANSANSGESGSSNDDFGDLPMDAFNDLLPPDAGADIGTETADTASAVDEAFAEQGDKGVDVDIPDIDFSPSLGDQEPDASAEPAGEEAGGDFSLDDLAGGGLEPGQTDTAGQDFELPDEFSIPDSGLDQGPADMAVPTSGATSDLPDVFIDDSTEIVTADKDTASESDDFLIDEFNLPEITDDLAGGAKAGVGSESHDLPSSISFKEKKPAKSVKSDEDISITDEQFEALQETLKGLPLNLKLAVEELIGKKNLSGEPLHNLLDYLITGRTPREIAQLVGQITGERVPLVKKFEKKTGMAFEAEKKSLGYAFQENIWPILRVVLPALIIVVILAFGLNEFVVQPLRALGVYQQGYDNLQANRFPEANEKFEVAVHIRPIKEQYFRFAKAFTDKQQYEKAAEKYSQLLEQYPGDKNGILDWANLETAFRKDHFKAEELLNRILGKEPNDYEALLAAGDNYLDWALSESGDKKAEYFSDAKESYFRILRTDKRSKNEPWFHLLHFFIVTDNLEETEKIKNQFEENKEIKVDPVVYAELGGYLITKDHLNDVKSILSRALKENKEQPETYYHFARYFREIDNKEKEVEALEYAKYYFDKKQPLTSAQVQMLINTLSMRGENFYAKADTLQAEQEYNRAIELIENNSTPATIPVNGDYGKVYYNRGDLHYNFYNDLNLALKDYQQAEKYYYKSPELDYKIGRIDYIHEDYQESLLRFFTAARAFPHEPSLLLALGNTYLSRNDYTAAQGEYLLLIDILEDRYSKIPLLRPAENPTHKNLLTKLMIAHNNLGVTLKRLAEAPRKPRKETESLLHFTKASEYGDLLTRNPDTEKRGEALSHGFINSRAILYPVSGYSLAVYQMLPKAMKDDYWPTQP